MDELYVVSNDASFYLDKSYIAALPQIYFFSCLGFLSQTFVIHKTAGESGLVG